MSIAFVIGNGISRQGIDLQQLRSLGKIYGCNALYREFSPDVLVATDRPIATAIQTSGYANNKHFYTRRPIDGFGAKAVPKSYFGYSSGPIAIALAAVDNNQVIYLLGFDMGPTAEKTVNNVYAGTEFYKSKTAPPTFTGNWVRQIVQVSKDFRQTQFVRVCGSTTNRITELESLPNLSHCEMDTFVYRINNKKDL
jgi:hypothetical protein